MYQSYRRVDIESRSVSGLYYGTLILATFAIAIMVFISHGHLQFKEPRVVRFIRTRQPKGFVETASCPKRRPDHFRCTVWDWLQIVEASRDELFVTTHVKEMMEKRVCPRTAESCKKYGKIWDKVNETHFYTASPEKMSVEIEHELIFGTANRGLQKSSANEVEEDGDHPPSPNTEDEGSGLWGDKDNSGGDEGFSSSADMRGILVPGPNCHIMAGSNIFPENEAIASVSGGHDQFSVEQMLAAAGVSFSESDEHDPVNATLRRDGIHLDVTVYYSNMWRQGNGQVPGLSWILPSSPAKYVYCVDADAGSVAQSGSLVEEKTGKRKKKKALLSEGSYRKGSKFITTIGEETTFLPRSGTKAISPEDETRVVRTHHGVHLRFSTRGHLASLSWLSALMFAAGALSLLSLPWTITELYLSLIPSIKKKVPEWYYGPLVHSAEREKKQK